jgi:hypothetical protein
MDDEPGSEGVRNTPWRAEDSIGLSLIVEQHRESDVDREAVNMFLSDR